MEEALVKKKGGGGKVAQQIQENFIYFFIV